MCVCIISLLLNMQKVVKSGGLVLKIFLYNVHVISLKAQTSHKFQILQKTPLALPLACLQQAIPHQRFHSGYCLNNQLRMIQCRSLSAQGRGKDFSHEQFLPAVTLPGERGCRKSPVQSRVTSRLCSQTLLPGPSQPRQGRGPGLGRAH